MLAIVQRLVIVGVEQPLEDLHGLVTVGRLREVPARGNQMFVAGGNVAAAGIAHKSYSRCRQAPAAMISSNSRRDSSASWEVTFWIA